MNKKEKSGYVRAANSAIRKARGFGYTSDDLAKVVARWAVVNLSSLNEWEIDQVLFEAYRRARLGNWYEVAGHA